MRVPLTIGDFLERAAHVYGDRLAVTDEPDAHGSLGELTYEELHHRARAMAVGFDSMGIGAGERVALVSPNSAKFLAAYFGVSGFGRVLVPINFRLTTDEIGYIVEHSGASVVLFDPELDGVTGRLTSVRWIRLDGVQDAELFDPEIGRRRDPASLEGRRGGDVLDQLHLGHHLAAEGGPAHPPELLAQRGELRLAHGRLGP